MQIASVAEVEQVIDDQLVVRLDGDAVALGRMHLRNVIEHAEVRHLGRVCRLVAHPDPDGLVLLDRRIAAHARTRRDVLRAMRVIDAGAGRIELKSVIRALHDIVPDNLAHMQRREAVWAAIFQRGHTAVRLAIEDDGFVHERAWQQLTVDKVIRPRRDVPRVAQIGSAHHLLFAFDETGIAHSHVHRVPSIASACHSHGTPRRARGLVRPMGDTKTNYLSPCLGRSSRLGRGSRPRGGIFGLPGSGFSLTGRQAVKRCGAGS